MPEIEILRVGQFTANDGTPHRFGLAELKEIAETYNPSYFKAPLTVSHRTQGIPDSDVVKSQLAFGFPSSLRVVGDRLKAQFDTIAPQFVQWVRDGQLLSVSSSLYTPNSPVNPYPGKWSLRHIAGLGAEPPAIKGMSSLQLSEAGIMSFKESPSDGTVDIVDFGGYASSKPVQAMLQRLREWFIEKHGIEIANQVLPAHAIASIGTGEDCGCDMPSPMLVGAQLENIEDEYYEDYGEMKQKNKEEIEMDFIDDEDMEDDEDMDDEDMEDDEDDEDEDDEDYEDDDEIDMAEYESRLIVAEQRAAEAEARVKRMEISNFIEEMQRDGKITTAMTKPIAVSFSDGSTENIGIARFMESLEPDQDQWFRSFIKGQTKQVSYDEYAPSYAESSLGRSAPKDSRELDYMIRNYQESNGCSYATAYKVVSTKLGAN